VATSTALTSVLSTTTASAAVFCVVRVLSTAVSVLRVVCAVATAATSSGSFVTIVVANAV